MRKIAIVSGSRSEYGLLRPVIDAIERSSDLEMSLVVTGSHMEEMFGQTIKDIEEEFEISDKLRLPLQADTNEGMSVLVGQGVLGFTEIFSRMKPAMVLVLGDRAEVFSAVIAAYYLNIAIGHIHGGDKSQGGHLDDSVRHAITKLAHIHFAATKESADRIIAMGEEQWRVHVVGSPGIDSICRYMESSHEDNFMKKIGIDTDKALAILLEHPITTEVAESVDQIRSILEVIKELSLQTVVIYPNADAGGRRMIGVIEEYRDLDFIHIRKNVSHSDFLGLMNAADVMVGNSSSGLIEAPFFKLPVVNVGKRQSGRERASNVIDVGYGKKEIKAAIGKSLSKDFRDQVKNCENPFGDGKSASRISKILSGLEINRELLQKKITY